MTRVAVLGTGSWGTAFSMVLADAGADIRIGARRGVGFVLTPVHSPII